MVPYWAADGSVLAVLDIDSKELNTFDAIDQHYLEEIAGLIPFPS